MKKIFPFICAAMLCSLQPAAAQEVTVTGMGADKDSALRDASRLAVEQVIGTLIDSRTLMQNLVIQLDEVSKKSQGFVKSVKILNENKINADTYRVKALIDVDTNPDAKLIDELTMLMRLNDPRIAVVVLGGVDANGTATHNEAAETTLNGKLLALGFNHVVDADHIIKLYDAKFLNNIFEGRSGLSKVNTDNACDFLVLGKASANLAGVGVPDYRTGQMMNAPLTNAQATLNVKILKYDTGDIIGTFIAKGSSMGNTNSRAADNALNTAAEDAAGQLEKAFKHFSSKVIQGISFTIVTNNYDHAEQIIKELRSLGDVNNVYIRSHDNGKTVLEVDTAQKPDHIVKMLRSRTKYKLVVESMAGNSVTLRVI